MGSIKSCITICRIGIAHEINNPANFIHGNLKPAQEYVQSLLKLVELYEKNSLRTIPEIQDYSDDIDLDFIKIDLPMIMESMGNGTTRIREIVLLLRNFARMDESELKTVNLHEETLSAIVETLTQQGFQKSHKKA